MWGASGKRFWQIRLSLRTKMTLILLVISLIPLSIVGFVSVDRASTRAKEEVQQQYQQAAQFAARLYEDRLQRLQREAQALAQRFPVDRLPLARLEAERASLTSIPGWGDGDLLQSFRPCMAAILIAGPKGRVISSLPYREKLSLELGQLPWFARLKEQGGMVLTELEPFSSKRSPGPLILAPLPKYKGQHSGFLLLVTLHCELKSVLKGAPLLNKKDLSLYLLDAQDRIVTRSPEGALGINLRLPRGLISKQLQERKIHGSRQLMIRVPLEIPGWQLFLKTPSVKAYQAVHRMGWIVSITIIFTFLFVLLFADYLAQKMLKPIQELECGAEMIGSGVLDYRIKIDDHSHDEIGKLALAFNEMGENLQQGQSKLEASKRNLEMANQELDSMVYGISHDLKKKLRGIEAFSTFLKEDYRESLQEEGRSMLDSIIDNVEQINQFADDLIRLVEHEKVKGELSSFSMKILLEEIKADLLLKRKGEISILGLMPEIRADHAQLRLLFESLLNNALKFNRNPNPKVSVRCLDQGINWVFEIQDNGIGIEPRYHEHIFELFSRLNHIDEFQGSGTGLNLSRRIVHEHRGDIEVRSELGVGTCFSVSLPKEANLLTSPGYRLRS